MKEEAEKVWSADLYCADGLVCVSQIVPRSIKADRNSDVPSDSCGSVRGAGVADFLVRTLWTSLCIQNANVGRCVRAVAAYVPSLRCVPSCRQARAFLQLVVQCPLAWWSKPLDFPAVSFVISKQQPATPYAPYSGASLCFYSRYSRASCQNQRGKDPQALIESWTQSPK